MNHFYSRIEPKILVCFLLIICSEKYFKTLDDRSLSKHTWQWPILYKTPLSHLTMYWTQNLARFVLGVQSKDLSEILDDDEALSVNKQGNI